ncbi:MAG: hypothetical protein OXC62_15885 [Aestuariivita sp.]|nr:hypothetical protein [Aestuariivita sp.]
MFQIKQRADNDRRIHAITFVAHQFYRTQDNLIDLWLHVIASFHAKATRDHSNRLLENQAAQQKQIKSVVNDLETSVFGLLSDIRDVVEADGISDTQKFSTIQALLNRCQSGAFEQLKDNLFVTAWDESWFDMLEAGSLRLQN